MAETANSKRAKLLKSLGPGLVWAATAVGVSHLVQSTRAGATYGFALVGAVIVANLLKYPFFEYGPRYAAARGESLLEGYERLGRWTVWVYLALTVGTMFTVVGAVTLVTGSLATHIFGPGLSPFQYSALILLVCAFLLAGGRYPLLDRMVKVVIGVLTVSTLAAVTLAAAAPRSGPVAGFEAPTLWNMAGFSFLIALVGWMPSAVDISVWHSLWCLERAKQTRYRPSLREALFDFNLGYLGTATLALIFLSLGALVMYGSGQELSGPPAAFADQLVRVYTAALGPWARPLILAAAFTTMFSTTLSCTDAFPRVLRRACEIVVPATSESRRGDYLYWGWMTAVVLGALVLIRLSSTRLTFMIDLATTLSFLTSPVLGYFNYRVVTRPDMPEGTAPPPWLRALTWIGLIFATAFGILFLIWRFGLR